MSSGNAVSLSAAQYLGVTSPCYAKCYAGLGSRLTPTTPTWQRMAVVSCVPVGSAAPTELHVLSLLSHPSPQITGVDSVSLVFSSVRAVDTVIQGARHVGIRPPRIRAG
jgi:hypothetical protein